MVQRSPRLYCISIALFDIVHLSGCIHKWQVKKLNPLTGSLLIYKKESALSSILQP